MHISLARLASFCHLGFISDPLIVSKFHNETHDPKGLENKIYTIVCTLISSDCLRCVDVNIYFRLFINGVARMLKKLRTSKGILLDQAVILLNCVPFHNWNCYLIVCFKDDFVHIDNR